MRNILSVDGFQIGEIFEHDGNLFRVLSFRSRNTVIGKLVHEFCFPAPQHIKVSLLSIDTMPFLNYSIRDRMKRDIKKMAKMEAIKKEALKELRE